MADPSITGEEKDKTASSHTPIRKTKAIDRAAVLREASDSPATPRSPLSRSGSPGYGSPGGVIRTDDGTLVFHFDERGMRAGLAGEPYPRSDIAFSPRLERRVGDYNERRSAGSAEANPFEQWGTTHELWRPDIRNLDPGHVYDKLVRMIRHSITQELLVHDSISRRIVLSLPSLFPYPLLSTLLTALFNIEPAPSGVTLLSDAIVCVFAAGLRSGLVVDVGWHATVVTAVYEYREVLQLRSCRGMRLLSWNMKIMLEEKLKQQGPDASTVSFEEVEDVSIRLAWCPTSLSEITLSTTHDTPITLPLNTTPLTLPFSSFSTPVTSAFFPTTSTNSTSTNTSSNHFDDNEQPLHNLVFNALLRLPLDLRSHLLHRIIVTGPGARIPGLTSRLLAEVSARLGTRGWDPVMSYGSTHPPKSARNSHYSRPPNPRPPTSVTTTDNTNASTTNTGTTNPTILVQPPPSTTSISTTASTSTNNSPQKPTPSKTQTTTPSLAIPTHLQPPLSDEKILQALRTGRIYSLSLLSPSALAQPTSLTPTQASTTPAVARAITTLGAWSGASLTNTLGIAGVVQISRDEFVKHGVASLEKVRLGGGVASVVAKGQDNGLPLREVAASRAGVGYTYLCA